MKLESKNLKLEISNPHIKMDTSKSMFENWKIISCICPSTLNHHIRNNREIIYQMKILFGTNTGYNQIDTSIERIFSSEHI